MKVFISWSGANSRRLGEAIRDWLPGVLQMVSPYFTPSDIEKGTRWSTDIAKELEESSVGIICVTRDNLHSDWILFEAGALSKRLQKSHVCPILFGITNTDLAGPLKQFQTTEFEKNDFQKLIGVINGQLGDNKLPQKTLEVVFEKWWPDLQNKINEILAEVDQPSEPIRSDRELLEEILTLNRMSLKRTQSPIAVGAIKELLQGYIKVHDEQMNENGGYQDTLNSLKSMRDAINHITRKYLVDSEVEDLFERFKKLSFEAISNQLINDEQISEDQIPF